MADPRKAAQIVEMALQRAKKAMLTQAEREANKAKFLEGSTVDFPVYRGDMHEIKEYKPVTYFGHKEVANQFADPEYMYGTPKLNPDEHPHVTPVHLNLKNPKIFTTDDEYEKYIMEGALDAPHWIKQGYDGVVYAPNGNFKDPDAYFVAFEPTQIKSAIGNQGTYDTTNPDITKAHGGIVHMAEGGDVSEEREQAELDRMRLELSNSPVIEATPQSTTQKLLGTVGGYMDRAGKFINKSLEPIAESNPVKTFLADMLLASPLKGAGTALQDYTKTSRDITEEQPYTRSPLTGSGETLRLDPRVLDIAQFASPVVRGATKLAGAGAKALTPFAKSTAEMAADLYSSGKMPMMVAPNAYMAEPSVPKPSRVLAPANEQGFYSPTEAAVLNLPRKSGSGQAFLNDIMKGENVRSEEISTMGLDTFLKDKKNVTAAEVQDYIAQNKLGLGEATYVDPESIYAKSEALNTKIAEVASKYGLRKQQFGSGFVNDKGEFVRDIPEDLRELQKQYVENRNLDPKTTKFKEWSLPGGENYREVVMTLPQAPEHSEFARLNKKMNDDGLLPDEMNRWTELGSKLGEEGRSQAREGRFKTAHWDETNPIAHLRMSDRVTDGKKTLLVDEVQSDWHQAARDARTAEVKRLIDEGMPKEEAQKAVPKNFGYRSESDSAQAAFRNYQADVKIRFEDSLRKEYSEVTSDPEMIERLVQREVNDKSIKQMSDHFGEGEKWKGLYDNYNSEWSNNKRGVSDAPFKEDWYQLALKRAVKEAIDGGYDRVALPTGQRVADRFALTAYIDRIDYNKNPDGTYRMSAIKDGQEVFTKTRANEKELPDIVGKEVAEKIRKNEGKTNNLPVDEFDADDVASQTYQTLSGLDLAVGGEGMKKYYDEIYPAYLKKFGKKYGANVGTTYAKTDIEEWPFPIQIESDGKNFWLFGQDPRIDKKAKLSNNFSSYEDANKFRDSMYEGNTEPLHYMDITPAMRKEFSTGIHMKDGGSVNLAEGGIVAGAHGLEYTDDGKVSMEDGGYVPMRRGGKVELTNDLAKMRNELQMKKRRK